MPGLLDTYRGLMGQPSESNPVMDSGTDVPYNDALSPQYGTTAAPDSFSSDGPPPGPEMETSDPQERDLLKELLARKAQERRERAMYYQDQAYQQAKSLLEEPAMSVPEPEMDMGMDPMGGDMGGGMVPPGGEEDFSGVDMSDEEMDSAEMPDDQEPDSGY